MKDMRRSRITLEEESRRAQRRVRRMLVGLLLTVVLGPVSVSLVLASWRRRFEVAELPQAPSPAVPTRPMPPGLLPGQRPAKNGCPPPSVELRGHPGCWMRVDKTTSCGAAYAFQGQCYWPYTEESPLPSP